MSYTVTVFGKVLSKRYRDVVKHIDEMEIRPRPESPRLILQHEDNRLTVISGISAKSWSLGSDHLTHCEGKNGPQNSEP